MATQDDDIKKITETITTQDDALALIAALRHKFGMVGTTFTRADLDDALSDAIRDVHDRGVPEEVEAATALEEARDQLLDLGVETYEFRRLGEVLATCGNGTLSEAGENLLDSLVRPPSGTVFILDPEGAREEFKTLGEAVERGREGEGEFAVQARVPHGDPESLVLRWW